MGGRECACAAVFPPVQEVEDMVKTALQLYDADRTGKFDYALETAGGSIPHALCSETFTPSASTVQLFGYTVWQYSNSPRTIIQVGGWGLIWVGWSVLCVGRLVH